MEPEPEPEPSLAIVPFSENMVFTNPRLLATRRFDLHGKTIVLEQQHQKAAMASEWDAGGSLTGAAVWDASLVLAHYLPQLGSWRRHSGRGLLSAWGSSLATSLYALHCPLSTSPASKMVAQGRSGQGRTCRKYSTSPIQ